MNKQIITFKADEQNLVKTGGTNCYASNIISYIEAHFDLGENWNGYDSVRAVWSNDNNMSVISTVLDSDGVCVVPFEVLKTKGTVMVNLVGSISASDVLTDRLTTFPCEAVKVARKAKINGSETTPITPSQFEQFVETVKADADRAEAAKDDARDYAADASASAGSAHTSEVNASASEDAAKLSELNAEAYKNQASASAESARQSAVSASRDADRAEQAAADAGFMEFYIDDDGHLIMEHTESVDDIDFELVNGHLILEVA